MVSTPPDLECKLHWKFLRYLFCKVVNSVLIMKDQLKKFSLLTDYYIFDLVYFLVKRTLEKDPKGTPMFLSERTVHFEKDIEKDPKRTAKRTP